MLLLSTIDRGRLTAVLERFGLTLEFRDHAEEIPGSFWGAPEAGLRRSTLYARLDTPLHSVLHESAHFICMDDRRRTALDTDAGGDDSEESAVCYLQICLARLLPLDPVRLCEDMDAWGYSFRLGAAAEWFLHDAQDARGWLMRRGILDDHGCITYARAC